MPVNPKAALFLDRLAETGAPTFDQMTVSQARAGEADFIAAQGEPPDVALVRDILVPGEAGQLPARLYHPAPGERRPVVVHLHGGGWVMGSLEVVDWWCRSIASTTGFIVVSVGFRLSPETQFPEPLRDCLRAVRWLRDHIVDLGGAGSQVIISGESSGGNLAAGITLMARDDGDDKPFLGQWLVYPFLAPTIGPRYPSYDENGEGYLLTRDGIEWFWSHYLGEFDGARQQYAFPLIAEDLHGLPPASIVVAEYDPLRDEGVEYAKRLNDAGIDVDLANLGGAIHGFAWLGGATDDAARALNHLAETAREWV